MNNDNPFNVEGIEVGDLVLTPDGDAGIVTRIDGKNENKVYTDNDQIRRPLYAQCFDLAWKKYQVDDLLHAIYDMMQDYHDISYSDAECRLFLRCFAVRIYNSPDFYEEIECLLEEDPR